MCVILLLTIEFQFYVRYLGGEFCGKRQQLLWCWITGVAATAEETVLKAGKGREIVHRNTRLAHNPFNTDRNKECLTQAASALAKVQPGRIGPDGKEILPAQSPKVGGYGFVATPSPAPGQNIFI